jgi:hypothetical protein
MRVQLAALTLLAVVEFPIAASAADAMTIALRERTPPQPVIGQASGLLQKLGLGLISRAHAAQCTEEGEACTSTQQCCPGLECTGNSPATCTPED